jgi:hypothetical protein
MMVPNAEAVNCATIACIWRSDPAWVSGKNWRRERNQYTLAGCCFARRFSKTRIFVPSKSGWKCSPEGLCEVSRSFSGIGMNPQKRVNSKVLPSTVADELAAGGFNASRCGRHAKAANYGIVAAKSLH